MIEVLTIETPTLGDRSYLAHDGEVALVVDPQRDTDRVTDLARAAGVRITHVVETHVHNDYVTGGHALAREVGAEYLLNADDHVAFERRGVRDGDVVPVGSSMALRVVATPGHTHTHLAYVLEAAGAVVAVFTGGSLLHGSTGRPDLLGPEHTEALAHAQWRSARRLAAELPDATPVHPTHGFGSFCSVGPTGGSAGTSTIGVEQRANPVLSADEQRWVDHLLGALEAHPAYYAHMAPLNAAGPDAPDLSAPAAADAAELRRRIDAGEWVVDLRTGRAFAAGHVRGSVGIGLEGQLASYLGWLMPWDTPVTLLAGTAEDVAAAQRELARTGIDRPAAMATGDPQAWAGPEELRTYPRATFADLAAAVRSGAPPVVLDVRRASERAGAAIAGSVHVPVHEVLEHLDRIPGGSDGPDGGDGEVWVHCAGGYRASIVASLLDAAGRRVVWVDDSFDHAAEAGLDVVRPAAVSA